MDAQAAYTKQLREGVRYAPTAEAKAAYQALLDKHLATVAAQRARQVAWLKNRVTG